MTVQMVIDIGQLSLITFLKIAGPMLIASMVIGVTVSLFQSMTQINEMTLTFVPKIIGVLIVGILALPWIVSVLIQYTEQMLYTIPSSLGL
jgi:flagellar biosynthetic protein FliQ